MKTIRRKADVYYLEAKLPLSFTINTLSDYSFVLQKNISNKSYLEVYQQIGKPWNWSGRILMTDEELSRVLNAKNTIIYYLKNKEDVLGYFELCITDSEAELVYFGLDKSSIGLGLGKLMMNKIKSIANEMGITRIWLHTCSFDSPRALEFYQKSGFKIYKITSAYENHIVY